MDGTTSEINMSKILVGAGCYVALEAGETWSYHFVAMAKQLQVQTEQAAPAANAASSTTPAEDVLPDHPTD